MTSYKGVDHYATVRERINDLFRSTESVQAIFDGVCAILTETLPHFTWAGIYMVEGNDLVLAADAPAASPYFEDPGVRTVYEGVLEEFAYGLMSADEAAAEIIRGVNQALNRVN